MRFSLVVAALALCLVGCNLNVERPRLTPRNVEWLGMSNEGIVFRITLAAYNPNTFELPLHDLRARLFLGGQDTGSSVTNLNARLPPMREVGVTVDVTMPLAGGITSLGVLATQSQIPYRLQGTLTVDHYFSVTTDFTQDGYMSRDILLRGIAPSIGNVINAVAPFIGVSGGEAR